MIFRSIAKKFIKFPFFNKLIINIKFRNEIRLVKGKYINFSENQSLIHFTLNKTASQFIKSILNRLASENNLVPINLNDYSFYTQIPFFDHLSVSQMSKYKDVFKSQGFMYSAFGGMLNGVDLSGFNILLTVRDPRDILVSSYYSMAFSHEIPPFSSSKREFFIKKRERALALSIDEYVLEECDNVFNRYLNYKKFLLDKYPSVKILKYEEMVCDFNSWIFQLEMKTGYKFCEKTRKNIIDNQLSQKSSENKNKQKRKGISGDYKIKLKESTINKINNKYFDILKDFGYI
ncbi:Sulfotransferase domain-containing protein [Cyclobacterium lianum]|uniref:Sulfotransferase domain-containing protein n=1 Tax=Cyclobacterium lianum TaxID=388280 RepID=A0A1M7NS96_9BACT|nr:sulfotransferase domain-containing protein [Cyclobacterium lianum]SHN06880.1 Sulfotransferase domain-containing protein [Cyclobacterium lianum]